MTLGNRIAFYRKNRNFTQDALAKQLGVTNQAVSKWESDQCCPDVMLLPKLAEIFGISMDELFGREIPKKEKSGFEKMFGISLAELDERANQQKRAERPSVDGLPWEDDNVLRVAVYLGRELLCGGPARPGYEFDVKRDVDGILSSVSGISITCGNVGGDVDAGGNVTCDMVGGDVDAGSSVVCGDVGGNVDAGTDVKCGDVGGDVDAGCNVECASVGGDIDAGAVVAVR